MDINLFTATMNAGFTTLPNLLLQNFTKLDLSSEELILIIQIKSFIDQGNLFPDIQDLSSLMNLSQDAVFRLIHQLTHKNILRIISTKNSEGKTQDAYSLEGLWTKLARISQRSSEESKESQNKDEQKSLFKKFEEEFSRPLSPIEIQTIGMWLEQDRYPVSLIEFALREAVLSQVYSLKYIDRILLTWEKKNIRTKEAAERESMLFREASAKRQQDPHEVKNQDPIPLHNWLNSNN